MMSCQNFTIAHPTCLHLVITVSCQPLDSSEEHDLSTMQHSIVKLLILREPAIQNTYQYTMAVTIICINTHTLIKSMMSDKLVAELCS